MGFNKFSIYEYMYMYICKNEDLKGISIFFYKQKFITFNKNELYLKL